jgi:lysophospholipase L1-like esterase
MTTLIASFALAGACALAGASDPWASSEVGVRIETSAVDGLGREAGVGRRDPSDVMRVGGLDLVLYTRLTSTAPLYPAAYTGEIWYATSSDAGHTWTERGPLLAPGPRGSFDFVGVFDPGVLRAADGTYWLFYSGVGPQFNFRFEENRRVEPIRIGLARLSIDSSSGEVLAERVGKDSPILSPSAPEERGFDSLRVGGAAPLLRNGLIHLYYRARSFGLDSSASALGLALSGDSGGPYERAHEGLAVLPDSGDALLLSYRGGVLALLSSRQRGLFWAPDGEHFARMTVRVSGQLLDPGASRDVIRPAQATASKVWGLHVGALHPDPFLERFEFELSEELPLPARTHLATPGSYRAAHWAQGTNWLAQHRATLEDSARRPHDYAFLGDELIEGFGGHGRSSQTPGATAWQGAFSRKEVINLGIAGDKTQNVLWRVDHGVFQHARCRAVIVQVGGNNVGQDDPEDIALGIESILRRLLHELPFTEMVLVSLVPRVGDGADRLAAVADCNQALARLARWPRVNYLDLAAILTDPGGAARPELFEAQGATLSATGYEKWAGALGPLLARIEELVPEGAAQKLDELEGKR